MNSNLKQEHLHHFWGSWHFSRPIITGSAHTPAWSPKWDEVCCYSGTNWELRVPLSHAPGALFWWLMKGLGFRLGFTAHISILIVFSSIYILFLFKFHLWYIDFSSNPSKDCSSKTLSFCCYRVTNDDT